MHVEELLYYNTSNGMNKILIVSKYTINTSSKLFCALPLLLQWAYNNIF